MNVKAVRFLSHWMLFGCTAKWIPTSCAKASPKQTEIQRTQIEIKDLALMEEFYRVS